MTKVPEEFAMKVKGSPAAEVALNVVELKTEELAAMSWISGEYRVVPLMY